MMAEEGRMKGGYLTLCVGFDGNRVISNNFCGIERLNWPTKGPKKIYIYFSNFVNM